MTELWNGNRSWRPALDWDGAPVSALDSTAPTGVAVIAPATGATVAGTTGIVATASDDTAVTQVDVYIDGNLVGQAGATLGWVYVLDTTTLADGAHTVYVIASDAVGNSTTSATVTFNVLNPVPAVPTAVASTISTAPRWAVFARDALNQRVGVVEWTELNFVERHNQPGTWTLETNDAGAAQLLLEPQAGIVVERNGEVMFSGVRTAGDRIYDGQARRLSLSGIDDLGRLAWRVMKPEPDTPAPPYNTASYDIRTGQASAIILGYISSNAGRTATPDRSIYGLSNNADPGLGSTMTRRARWVNQQENLLAFVASVAARSTPELNIEVASVLDQLLVDVSEVRDLTRQLVYSIDAGTLRSYKLTVTAPSKNYAYVAGDGVGTARLIIEAQDSTSIADAGRVEAFIDQRQTTSTAELRDAATEAFRDGASSRTIECEIVTNVDQWPNTGDLVTVVIDTEPFVEVVRERAVMVNADGERASIVLGPVGATSSKVSKVFAAQRAQSARVAALESI